MEINIQPTDPKYIEALAKTIADPEIEPIGTDARRTLSLINKAAVKSYQLALEHTNHAELVDTVTEFILVGDELQFNRMKEALTKSQTSKLK